MADEIEWTPVKVRLGDLSHWADNPVTLSKAQAKKLLHSKEKLGKMQTLAIGPSNGDGKHPLYDGHQRANVWGAAFGMGLEVWALQSSRALTDDERHAVPIMLRTAVGSLDWDALAGWTDWPLGEWGLDDDALQGMKFDIAALGNLLESETPEPADAEPQIDRAEELNEKWQVKTGDLWRIGEHRLLCGDSTRREDVERVMQGERAVLFATDPPYGANAGNIGFTAQRDDIEAITKDNLEGKDMQAFLELAFRAWIPSLSDNAAWYLWHPMLTQGYFAAAAAAAADLIIHRQIIWVKEQFIFGRGDYHWRHELCFYGWRKGNRPNWHTERNQDTVWNIAWGERRGEIGHPTAKPPEIFSRPMRNHTREGDICAEPFAGSGSQFVAGENLKRRVFGCEIEQKYCSVILERMATAFPDLTIARIE